MDSSVSYITLGSAKVPIVNEGWDNNTGGDKALLFDNGLLVGGFSTEKDHQTDLIVEIQGKKVLGRFLRFRKDMGVLSFNVTQASVDFQVGKLQVQFKGCNKGPTSSSQCAFGNEIAFFDKPGDVVKSGTLNRASELPIEKGGTKKFKTGTSVLFNEKGQVSNY